MTMLNVELLVQLCINQRKANMEYIPNKITAGLQRPHESLFPSNFLVGSLFDCKNLQPFDIKPNKASQAAAAEQARAQPGQGAQCISCAQLGGHGPSHPCPPGPQRPLCNCESQTGSVHWC